jgi:hypothetical protein
MGEADSTLNRVGTISDWWDGPLAGVAEHNGSSHVYTCPFDVDADEWAYGTYRLSPIDPDAARLALEMDRLAQRCQSARMEGRPTEELLPTWPVTPEDRPLYDVLKREVGDRLDPHRGYALTVTGDFLPPPGALPGRWNPTHVRWTEARPSPGAWKRFGGNWLFNIKRSAVNPAWLLEQYGLGARVFEHLELDDTRMDGAVLADSVFHHCWFHSCSFEKADLRRAVFSNCNAKCMSVAGADFSHASFPGSVVCGTTFKDARTEGISLEGASTYGAELKYGDIV